MLQLQTEPYSPEWRAEIERHLAAHPDNPFLRFGAAWMAQRAGDPAAAERHYRRVLAMWPNDDRVLNNLGNTLASVGRSNEALEYYGKAAEANPKNAAARFNASQIYTLNFDFPAATIELERASALDFELVETYQAERIEPRWAVLVDQWIAPRTFWHTLLHSPYSGATLGALPPWWRARIECTGRAYGLVALLLAAAGLVLGLAFQRELPIRGCVNCGRAMCRRCAARRRSLALCHACAAIESRAESTDFGRVLLTQHRSPLFFLRTMSARCRRLRTPALNTSFSLPWRIVPSTMSWGISAVLAVVQRSMALAMTRGVPHMPIRALACPWRRSR